jgi:hypothetical protein
MKHYMEAAMNRFTMMCGTVLLLMACMVMLPNEASAQKKKVAPKAVTATEQASPTQSKMGNTVKDLLAKYKGEKTNLGVLTRIEGDYFVVEDDGVSTIHPLNAIIGIKLLKLEEGDEESAKIEITLMR